MLPTGVLEDNAADFLSLGGDSNLEEQEDGLLSSGVGLDSEEEENDEYGEDFDEAYE